MGLVKLNDRGVRSATTFGSLSGGSMVFIKKLTASSSDYLTFVNGTSDVVLDDTYKEYLFTFKDIHPASQSNFSFNLRDGGTEYDATKTTTWFQADHDEGDTTAALAYSTGKDLAQSTSDQPINGAYELKTDNDACCAGYLLLFNPASTTFVKHFIGTAQWSGESDFSVNSFVTGYANVTAAIDGVRFNMSTGNIDAGDICLYGIK